MSNRSGCILLILAVFVGSSTFTLFAETPAITDNALTILTMAEKALFPGSYETSMTMETVRPGKAPKRMSFTILAKEGVGSLMEITAPSRSKGICFLQKNNTLLMYSPRSGSRKAIRLSSQESFQGSLFANSDVSDSTYSDDYTPKIKGVALLDHPELGEVQTILLEGVASHDKAPYGKIEIWVLPDRYLPIKFNFYSKSGLLFRTMILSDIRPLGGSLRPALMHMEAIPEPGAWTEVRIESLTQQSDLSDSLFTETNLTR